MIDEIKILKEIKTLKQHAKQFRNRDYIIGYISALSTVEGLIAHQKRGRRKKRENEQV